LLPAHNQFPVCQLYATTSYLEFHPKPVATGRGSRGRVRQPQHARRRRNLPARGRGGDRGCGPVLPSEPSPILPNICSSLRITACAPGWRSPMTSWATHQLTRPSTPGRGPSTRIGARRTGSASGVPGVFPRRPHIVFAQSGRRGTSADSTRSCGSPSARSIPPTLSACHAWLREVICLRHGWLPEVGGRPPLPTLAAEIGGRP
jgi:hypothetical protein